MNRVEIQYRDFEEIFDKYEDWDTEKKFRLFVQWLNSLGACTFQDNLMESFEDYISNVAEEEAVSFQDPNEPTINFTAKQINQSGAWLKFCDWYGMDEYAMAEGQCDSWETFKIPLSKAKEWRLI